MLESKVRVASLVLIHLELARETDLPALLLPVLPSIVNAVILLSAFSAANSDLYAGSRVLYALAIEGKVPRFLRKTTKHGLPIWSIVFIGAFGLLAFLT